VATIAANPFAFNGGLTTFVVAGGTNFRIDNGALFNYDMTTLIAYPAGRVGASFEIPATVTEIAAFAFAGASYLTNITFADASNITSIGQYAFAGTSITAFDVTALGTVIPAGLFADTNLAAITLPNNVTSIGAGAFAGTNLTAFTFPESWNGVIAERLFDGARDLASVNFGDNNTSGAAGANGTIGYAAFRNAGADVAVGQAVVIPNGVHTIGTSAFAGSGFSAITIPASVNVVGQSAFRNATNLVTVTFINPINTYIPQIPNPAYPDVDDDTVPPYIDGTPVITQVANTNLVFGAYAFAGTTNLEEVVVLGGIRNVSRGMFMGSGVQSVAISTDVVIVLSAYAFADATTVNLIIPANVFLASPDVFRGWAAGQTITLLGRRYVQRFNDEGHAIIGEYDGIHPNFGANWNANATLVFPNLPQLQTP
jgi:hypothetical protein